MFRRIVSAALFLVALLLVPVSITAMLPASAAAEISGVVWLDTAYKGNDPLLGAVQACEAGSTATLKATMQNTVGETISIRGAKVRFDWAGGEYAAGAGEVPATLAQNETGMATVSFTVPDEATVCTLVPHDYTVSVDWERPGGYLFGGPVTGQSLGTGDGLQTVFPLSISYVDPAGIKVYLNGAATTDYVLTQPLNIMVGATVTFNTAPAAGWTIVVDYQSTRPVTAGDGHTAVFNLANSPVPIVRGTEKVYVGNVLSTSHAIDYDSGTIAFTTPPAMGAHIDATYQYYQRWTATGSDFAVYSADQSAAMAARQKLVAIGTPSLNTTGSRGLAAKSAMEEQLGDQAYAAGNVQEARTHYEQALTSMESALGADKDPNTLKEVEPTGRLLLGIGMVLLAFGVLAYAFLKPRGG